MALAAEAGELLAEFQWLTTDESMLERLSSEQRNAIEMEIADVMIYLVRLCDVLQIDLVRAAETKLAINEERFPLQT
jgi:NTP pyrophosphatase (non-canonical NTP hydrolase)